MKAYSNLFDEFAVAEGLALPGERIVMPREFRETKVKIAHEGQKGIVRNNCFVSTFGFPEMIKLKKSTLGMPSLSSYHPLPHERATPNVGSADRPGTYSFQMSTRL